MKHGVLNFLKPPGMTSHDAVAFVRRVLGEKRVGHTGTLDPAAAGVLPICVGQATRLVEDLQAGTKQYLAESTFGFETDAGDLMGATVREVDASNLKLETLRSALDGFRGEITQTPPLHSAIKVGGKKLYELAREGQEIEIPTRQVTISQLYITHFIVGEQPKAFFEIECSGGTYIRSLVRDIGRELDLAATMSFLLRTRSGAFAIENAISPQEFEQNPILTPLAEVLEWVTSKTVEEEDDLTLALWQGKRIIAPVSNSTEPHDHQTVNTLRANRAEKIAGMRGDYTLYCNCEKTLFALAVPTGDGLYRAEKVFDLRG